MVKIGKKEKNDQLYKAILQLKDEQECYDSPRVRRKISAAPLLSRGTMLKYKKPGIGRSPQSRLSYGDWGCLGRRMRGLHGSSLQEARWKR